jgi:fucokinase
MSNSKKLKNLFLYQSTLDAWDEYQKSLHKVYYTQWDYVILTASNEEQALAYRMQIDKRQQQSLLPSVTHYAVISDPDGKRVGSGGATLNVLKYIREISDEENCFLGKRVLVIHSGGDSKRVPQYSACGKLFSPVPRQLPDGRRSTLFDEFIIAMSGVPARMKDGMLVLSGDVLLLFNPLQIDFQFEGAAAISMKEKAEIGKNHGVFLSDGEGNVGNFLHKMSLIDLANLGAVNEQGNVDLDTGAIIMDSTLLNSLFRLICTDGKIDHEKFDRFVNDRARLSFYGDFLYPLASRSTLEKYYLENPEGDFSEELIKCRKAIWDALHPYCMKLICLSPAQFIHFGTTKELLELITDDIDEYRFLNWEKNILTNRDQQMGFACNNAFMDDSVIIDDKSYIEDSYLYGNTQIGSGCVIANTILRDVSIPDGVTLHGLKLQNGKYVARIYGTQDNPKDRLEDNLTYLGIKLKAFINQNKINIEQLWVKQEHFLWTAKLFPICDTMEEAVNKSLTLIEILRNGSSDISSWLENERISLSESFNEADVKDIIPWQEGLDLTIRKAQFVHAIQKRKTAEEATKVFGYKGIDQTTIEDFKEFAKHCDFSTKLRIYYYLSKVTKGKTSEELENLCFSTIKNAMTEELTSDLEHLSDYRIQKEDVIIELPVRVNFGGGWSDTPPYCNEMGGTVLNISVKLENRLPVVVQVKKIDQPVIALASTDSGVNKEFRSLHELQDCSNPFDPFALHKAALITCGLIPLTGRENGLNLQDIISSLGSGMYLSTQVVDIPRGSGLGTSSILAGACVKGIYEFIGKPLTDSELYSRVIMMEQIMSTGGGWQDQVGGVTNSLKFITSKPGMKQEINVVKLKLSEETKRELQERFALIYTGQRRLARNLLREVVGRYISSDPNSVEVLYKIQRYAAMMRFELEKGNIDAFAKLLNEHWELSKKLDHGCTNTCIDQIFLTCEDLLAGKMICGAGGGGFLQVILKKGVTKDSLRKRIKEVFQESKVDVWDCEFLYE